MLIVYAIKKPHVLNQNYSPYLTDTIPRERSRSTRRPRSIGSGPQWGWGRPRGTLHQSDPWPQLGQHQRKIKKSSEFWERVQNCIEAIGIYIFFLVWKAVPFTWKLKLDWVCGEKMLFWKSHKCSEFKELAFPKFFEALKTMIRTRQCSSN